MTQHAARAWQKCSVGSTVAAGAVLAATIGVAQPAYAVDKLWTGTAGDGQFSTDNNWNPAPEPGSGDRAVFDTNTTVNVGFASGEAINNQGLDLRHTTGGTTNLDLNGGNYTVNSTTPIRLGYLAGAINDNKLVISNGSILGTTTVGLDAQSLGGPIAVGTLGGMGNELEFNGGAIVHGGNVSMNVGTSATPGNNNIVRFTGAGTTYTTAGSSTSIIGGASATLGAASGVGNALIISNQAVFNSVNNFYVGGTGGAANGPSNYIEVDNASYINTNANRGIILRDGTLRIKNNASVQPGMLNMTEAGTDASIDFQGGLLNVQRWRVLQNSTHTIGDGTGASATYRTPGTTSFAGVTVGVGNTLEPTSAFNLVLNTDGRMEARGTIAGSVSALGPGATATMDTDAPENREILSVLGNWDGTNIALTMKLGDFPTELAEDLAAMPPQAFVPPQDALAVGGLYTHGNSVMIDLQYYVAPQDQNYELQMISWGSVAGVAPTVNFINGAPLAYEWRSNGLFLTAAVVPEPAALSMLGLGALGLLARRRRR